MRQRRIGLFLAMVVALVPLTVYFLGCGGGGSGGGGGVTTSRFVFVANSDASSVSVFRIQDNGALESLDNVALAADSYPTMIALHPNGKFLYVVNSNASGGEWGDNASIGAYAYSADTGAIAEIEGSPFGWPLDGRTGGGSFLYHFDDNLVSVGFVLHLNYTNPYLSPFEEFQRFKTHPAIRGLFEGGRRISYGSRALTEGGYQSIPKLSFPGGALIGCGAGFMNVPRIKGIHNAMKSGMIAAESVFDLLRPGAASTSASAVSASASSSAASSEARDYRARLDSTWLMKELRAVRNIRPGFHLGLLPGLAYAAIDTYVLRGRAPWTLGHRKDHETFTPTARSRPIDYPKPDGKLTFDRLSSVFVSNTNHAENQPCHLKLADPAIAITVNNADRVIEQARSAGGRIVREPAETFWGGYSGVFVDIDGHPWEVAVNAGFPLAADGSITLPPR